MATEVEGGMLPRMPTGQDGAKPSGPPVMKKRNGGSERNQIDRQLLFARLRPKVSRWTAKEESTRSNRGVLFSCRDSKKKWSQDGRSFSSRATAIVKLQKDCGEGRGKKKKTASDEGTSRRATDCRPQ